MLSFLALACLVAICAADPSVLQYVPFNATDAVAARAVCNDQSIPGYYIRRGRSQRYWYLLHAHVLKPFLMLSAPIGAETTGMWFIHFEGGFMCWNSTTCEQRWQDSQVLMSSNGWTSTVTLDGIFNDDAQYNPMFYNATAVRFCVIIIVISFFLPLTRSFLVYFLTYHYVLGMLL
jgi:hypothetical protein